MDNVYEYGMWGVAITSMVFFTLFALGFFLPKKRGEWRALGLFEGFIVALYTEMYGFPLTVYLLSSFLGIEIPFLHVKGHLWATIFGWGDKGAMVEMGIGTSVMLVGMGLVALGWQRIHRAQNKLVTDGVYRIIRHPQYLGFILITTGMLIHWPTLVTLIMFPILTYAYVRLARREEIDLQEHFGGKYLTYKHLVPAFIPVRASYSGTPGVEVTMDGTSNPEEELRPNRFTRPRAET